MTTIHFSKDSQGRQPFPPVFQGTPEIQKLSTLGVQIFEKKDAFEKSAKREVSTSSQLNPMGKTPSQNTQSKASAKANSVGTRTLPTRIAATSSKKTIDFTFQALNRNPYAFFLALDDLSRQLPDLLSHGLKDLDICGCPRLAASSRMFLEEQALDLLGHSHNKRSLLTIVSVGPGRCYQELVYLAKFVNAGYQRIQLVLIDKEEIPIKALKKACREYLSKCNINLVYYPSLESYKEVAANRNDRKPDLLLLLDLTAEECEIHQIQFEEYCFKFFNENNLMKEKTVIASSDSWTNEKDDLFSVAFCGIHDGTTETLSSGVNKREYLTKVDTSLPPVVQ